MDEVVARLSPGLQIALDSYSGTIKPWIDWHDFDLSIQYPTVTFDTVAQLIIDSKLLEHAPPIPSALEGMHQLNSMGFDLHVITARGFHPIAHEITETWLHNHDVSFTSLTVVDHGQPKSAAYTKIASNFAYMFDDNADNIRDAEQSGIVEHPILINAPWNTNKYNYINGVNRFTCVGEFSTELVNKYNSIREVKTDA